MVTYSADLVSLFAVMLRRWIPSITPPRLLPVLTNSAYQSWPDLFAGLTRQFCAYTWFAPPPTSLPTQIAPRLLKTKSQFSMTMFCDGTPTRCASTSRPDLIAMQSSPVSKVQPTMCTSLQHSGSQPSLLPPPLRVLNFTLRTVMLLDSTGCTAHIGGRSTVIPSIRMFLLLRNSTMAGRSRCPGPYLRCATGVLLAPCFCRLVQSEPPPPKGFQAAPCPSSVPEPVTARLVRPSAWISGE